jgi:membrane protein DedA with SNARE-associated domain
MTILTDIIVFLSSVVIYLITAFGYLGIFLTMAMESAALPIPSEIVMPFAGFVASQGGLDFWAVVIAGTLGNLIGSIILYYVGLKGGRPVLMRYGRYLLISEREIKIAEEWFRKFGSKVIFFSRMLPVVRTFVSLPAGAAKMDIKKFSFYTLVGSVPWNIALTYIGFVLGENWQQIEGAFRALDVAIVGIGAIVIAFIAYSLFKKKSRR